jgi:hypothetical protein
MNARLWDALGVVRWVSDVTLSDDGGKPRPAGACSAAEFVEALRRFKRWSGLGYRELEKRARSVGEVLPRSTLTAALARDSLPREDLVVAFVRTCGGDEEELRQWVETRRRIAAAGPGADTPDPSSPGHIVAPAAHHQFRAALAPIAIHLSSRPVRTLVAAVVMAIAASAVLVAVRGPGKVDQTIGTGAATPAAPTVPVTPAYGICDHDSKHWIGAYLGTNSGPVSRYIEVVKTPVGESGRAGLYNPLTEQFVPQTGWMNVHSSEWYRGWIYEEGSLVRYYTVGYASLVSGYGPAVWATQLIPAENATPFIPGAPIARWGTWNLLTNRFYPSSDWTATDNAPCRIRPTRTP